jgi:hypothetical protein
MEDTDIHRDVKKEVRYMLSKSWRHRWKKRQISRKENISMHNKVICMEVEKRDMAGQRRIRI